MSASVPAPPGEKPPRNARRWLRILGGLFLSLLFLAAAGYWYLARWDGDGETPPAGFANHDLLIAALLTRAVKLIDKDPPLPPNVEIEEGIEYGQVGECSLQLDLYKPKNLQEKVPGLIFIHGGGWKTGQRQDYRVYTTWFAQQGYVVATIGYPLTQGAKFPAVKFGLLDSKVRARS